MGYGKREMGNKRLEMERSGIPRIAEQEKGNSPKLITSGVEGFKFRVDGLEFSL
jgi:hypothetical protein